MQTQLVYKIKEFLPLAKLQHLLPDSILIGESDVLPGVRGQNGVYLPAGPEDVLPNMEVSFSVYILNVRVKIPEFVETEIISQMQKFVLATSAPNVAEQATIRDRGQNIRIIVKDRKLAVAYHNGWRPVNSRGL